MIVTKDSDQQKRTDRESQTDENTGVPGGSRLLHHPCQRHFVLNPLCPKYHSLTCNNPGGKHWNLLPKGIQAYAAWIVRSSLIARQWAGLGWGKWGLFKNTNELVLVGSQEGRICNPVQPLTRMGSAMS